MDLLKFAKSVGKLKKTKRAGWVREKIKNSESVADHSFRVVVLCMILAKRLDVDCDKLIQMAIIHDLGESKIGDLIVERADGIDLKSRQEKEQLEKEAIKELFFDVGLNNEYECLFDEMIKRESKEAKIFWQLDKLEMAIQALEYEEEQRINLNEFFDNAEMHIEDSALKNLIEEIKNSRG